LADLLIKRTKTELGHPLQENSTTAAFKTKGAAPGILSAFASAPPAKKTKEKADSSARSKTERASE
jgi:hypothetical protein